MAATERQRRLALALDLFSTGVDLERQRLLRAHPEEDDAQRAARLRRWLRERDGHCDPPYLTARVRTG